VMGDGVTVAGSNTIRPAKNFAFVAVFLEPATGRVTTYSKTKIQKGKKTYIIADHDDGASVTSGGGSSAQGDVGGQGNFLHAFVKEAMASVSGAPRRSVSRRWDAERSSAPYSDCCVEHMTGTQGVQRQGRQQQLPAPRERAGGGHASAFVARSATADRGARGPARRAG
jgi:hypothetical protein